jgi:single-strand DNA-binding protein
MKGYNQVIIAGNLGTDPQCNTLQNGTSVATISVGTNESYKDANGQVQERVEWHRVVFWSKLADIVRQYLRKGSAVLVSGKLRSRKYTDQTGAERTITEIIANDLVMLPSGNNQTGGYNQPQQQNNWQNQQPQQNNWNQQNQQNNWQQQQPNNQYNNHGNWQNNNMQR